MVLKEVEKAQNILPQKVPFQEKPGMQSQTEPLQLAYLSIHVSRAVVQSSVTRVPSKTRDSLRLNREFRVYLILYSTSNIYIITWIHDITYFAYKDQDE